MAKFRNTYEYDNTEVLIREHSQIDNRVNCNEKENKRVQRQQRTNICSIDKENF